MDDGDGAFAVELMAGQPNDAILQTIYNGSAACPGCGMVLTPVAAMYGGLCPDCLTAKNAKNIQKNLGR